MDNCTRYYGRNQTRPGPAGFTLVELLAVITILVLIMAIAYPVILTITRDVRMTKTRTIISELDSGCQIYHNDHGQYPDSGSEQLVSDMTGLDTGTNPTVCSGGDYNAEVPGFQVTDGGKVYGPYNNSDKYTIVNDGGNYFFEDAFGNEIKYFKSGDYTASPPTTPAYLSAADYTLPEPDGSPSMPTLPYAIISPGYRWDFDGDGTAELWDPSLDSDPRTDVNNARLGD